MTTARLRRLSQLRAHSRVHQVCHVIVGFHRTSHRSAGKVLYVNFISPRICNSKYKVLFFWMLQSDFVLSSSTQSVSQILAYFTGFRQSSVNNGLLRSITSIFCEFLGKPSRFLPLPPSRGSPLFVLPVRNGLELVNPPTSWCKRFDVDNAYLKSERFLNGWVSFPDLLKEIHQLFLW